jgi:hypothetical protein
MMYKVTVKVNDVVEINDRFTKVTAEKRLTYNEIYDVYSLISSLIEGCGEAELQIKEVKDDEQ